MPRSFAIIVIAGLLLAALPAVASATLFRPGAPGIGDPYFPLDGNGGYDAAPLLARHAPTTRRRTCCAGSPRSRPRPTQDLSSFNLDLIGLTIRSVTVDGRPARWSRSGGELTITPRHGLRRQRATSRP